MSSATKSKSVHSMNPPVTGYSAKSTVKLSQFYMACRNNDIDVVTAMLPTLTLEEIDQIEPNGSTALHAATYYGNKEIVKMLLAKGAQRTIRNRYDSTPFHEAQTDEIKKLFQRSDATGSATKDRFVGKKGSSYEWIFVQNDPASYASFNRESLMKCRKDEEFHRLCRGIRQQYINENGPLASVEGIDIIRSYFDRAMQINDSKQVVRAYTAETGFYRRLNEDLSQMPTHWSGTRHERSMISILMFHPELQQYTYMGETHRGMMISSEELKEYVVGTVFMNKTFLSTSKDKKQTEKFITYSESSTKLKVVCKYLIKHEGTALDIEAISEFEHEREVLILPYASFKVKSIQKSTGINNDITQIDVEEIEEQVKWTKKSSFHSSHSHVSAKKKTNTNTNDEDDSYQKMFKDAQENGKIDPADLAKWTKTSFGTDSGADTYAKIWNDAKKGKFSKSDVAKWKKQSGAVSNGDDLNDSDLDSIDGENDPSVFTASNEQSYATSKKFSSKEPFDMKKFMSQIDEDSDG
ncbi:unnamed protein product [Adineta ricciae]|uniref:NAD(P)(+)--arginine ADP-ribosyltransferase n=1 Tax=Adineta ricciae TaxID=249248 RepID=A0A814UI78_ADIRI|nr:unnamed protein product [Adineta ricciae]CAF1511171.1 unnamed protein product [Adineta ricciae]